MSEHLRTLLETRRFRVVEQSVVRRDGQPANLKYIKHPGSVAILPMVDDDHVCLIRSRRLTVGKTLIEIPAGTCEPNERPLETAARELAEETGYRADRFNELTAYYPSPGITDERMWLFVATGLAPGEHAREPNEEIENYVVSWADALGKIRSGEIEDGKSMVALLMYDRIRSA